MANALKHKFVSAKADGPDTTKVRATNWNEEHVFAGGNLGALLYRDAGQSDGANWLNSAQGVPYWSGAGVAPVVTQAPTLTRAILTHGTITTDVPTIDVTVTWNDAAVTFTAWKLNVTSTASAPASNLIDLQVASASKWKVSKAGAVTQAGDLLFSTDNANDIGASVANRPRDLFLGRDAYIGGELFGYSGGAKTRLNLLTDGDALIRNAAGNNFSLFKFGGTTSSFPALKRVGTTLVSRLADDSADAPFQMSQLLVSGVGPHAIGGATNSQAQFSILGSWAERIGVYQTTSISPPTNSGGSALRIGPAFIENSSGNHSLFSSVQIDIAAVTAGAATVTDTASLYIAGAMSATVSGANYAAWIGGLTRIDGNLNFNGVGVGNVMLKPSTTTLAVRYGDDSAYGDVTTGFMTVTSAYLGPGTVATTGDWRAQAGFTFRARNQAGTANVEVLLTSSDSVQLGGTNAAGVVLQPSTGDIKWGKALVALGGGAAPTLGTIGGSGPASTGQNSWMRVLDSAGEAFWVAAWK